MVDQGGYILRSWSLVRMGTTVNQKKLFFNLRKAKSKISVLDEGDMRPDQVKLIAKQLGVTETDVINMNRRLGGDASLNATIREDVDSGEWQDWLMDESPDQETALAASEEFDNRRKALADALGVLDGRDRRIFEGRRLAGDPSTLAELANELGVSRERVRQLARLREGAEGGQEARRHVRYFGALASVNLAFRCGAPTVMRVRSPMAISSCLHRTRVGRSVREHRRRGNSRDHRCQQRNRP
jgi:hypothetical protein